MENESHNTSDLYYLTKEGYRVFTEKYHLLRGHCCTNNCKHCPYGFDAKTNTYQPNKTSL